MVPFPVVPDSNHKRSKTKNQKRFPIDKFLVSKTASYRFLLQPQLSRENRNPEEKQTHLFPFPKFKPTLEISEYANRCFSKFRKYRHQLHSSIYLYYHSYFSHQNKKNKNISFFVSDWREKKNKNRRKPKREISGKIWEN